MSRLRLTVAVILAACGIGVTPVRADDGSVDYLRDIKPVLHERCFACHGALKNESGLRADTAKALLDGGDSGAAIVPGKSGESLLVEKVTAALDEGRMPPEGEPLTAAQIDALRRWIDAGAPMSENEEPEPDPRAHWAYQPPVRPAVPQVPNAKWVRNPIDAFLAVEHERLGLVPNGPAEPHVLLRRVYLNLTGLPPTREALAEFAGGKNYEDVVDKLLASPAYGQRWARHWMDVWRYSDWSGEGQNLVRGSPRHIWRWRDWIVDSLNADKTYDRMITEMLAGDEIAPDDPDVVRATGFLARNWYEYNRNIWLDDTVEHTAKAFMGLTLACAKCHDHKFDPVSQQEYYAWRAIFEPHEMRIDPVNGQTDLSKDGLPRVYDAHAETPTYLFVRGDEAKPDKEHPLVPRVPAIFAGGLTVEPVSLPLKAYYPGMHDEGEGLLRRAEADVAEAKKAVASADDERLAEKTLLKAEAELASLQARVTAERAKMAQADSFEHLAKNAAVAERRANLQKAELAVLSAEQKLAAAQQEKENGKGSKTSVSTAEKNLRTAKKALTTAEADLKKTDSTYSPLGPQYPPTSTGRRLALARWLTDPQNPLTARVAVNHVWLRHFGEPLVETVDDFGRRTPRPRHTALLDWLTCEFVESGWSLKHLNRLIVTSGAYRLASATRDAPAVSLRLDPENYFLWRMNVRRAEGEVIRDSVLCVAGNLDLTAGGPEISLSQGESSRRRSLYFRHATERQVPFLEMFDGADAMECYRRSVTVVPQQALALANSPLPYEQARLLAEKLGQNIGNTDDAEFIGAAFEQVLSRRPISAELTRCRKFLQETAAEESGLEARAGLVHALFNHNEFISIR